MIKKIFRVICRSILIVFLLGLLSAFVDYLRMNDSKLPIFCVSSYDASKKTQYFQGMFYTASRKCRGGADEDLVESTKLRFNLLYKFDLVVETKNINNKDEEYSFVFKKITGCDKASLYYADLDIKVYTYCISSVMMNNKELSSYFKSNKNIIDDVDSSLSYMGLYNSTNTLVFNGSNIKMYRCSNGDVYIGEKDTPYNSDFCTNKDDDLKFIFEIKKELDNDTVLPDAIETFYEDENYMYQFNQPKSDFIYITTPEVRGHEAKKIKLKEVLNNKLLSIDDLEKKGLKFTKVDKNKK